MPEVTQEQYEVLQRVEERKESKRLLREAQKVVLAAHQDEVKAAMVRLSK